MKREESDILLFFATFLIALSQIAGKSFFKYISYEDIMMFPKSKQETDKVSEFINKRLAGTINRNKIEHFYNTHLSRNFSMRKRINDIKQVIKKQMQVNFSEEMSWFSFKKPRNPSKKETSVVLRLKQETKKQKIFENIIISDNTDTPSSTQPMNLSALLNSILSHPCPILKSDRLIKMLVQEVNDQTLSEISNYISKSKLSDKVIPIDPTQLKRTARSFGNFIKNDLKSILGKIHYKYVINSNDEYVENEILEFMEDDNVRYVIGNILTGVLCANNYFVDDEHLSLVYIQKYIILLSIKDLPDRLQDFLIRKVRERMDFDLQTVESIRLEYEKQRESKKSRQMEAFQNMDKDIRKMAKELIDMRLLDKEENTLKRFVSRI
jgi:hypothetical protein